MQLFGDNGIISNAMAAIMKTNIAVLEEFFQNEYVELYAYKEEGKTPLEVLMEHRPQYFFRTAEGYVLDSENHKLYLIQKSGLPEDLQSSVTGGSGQGRSAYYNQLDVYGITSH